MVKFFIDGAIIMLKIKEFTKIYTGGKKAQSAGTQKPGKGADTGKNRGSFLSGYAGRNTEKA